MANRKPAYDPGFGLADNLNALMKERGHTQRSLADAAGVSPTWISNLQRGKVTNPGAYGVYRLALALRVPMEEIMGVSRLAGRSRMRRTYPDGLTVDEILKENSPEPIRSPQEQI